MNEMEIEQAWKLDWVDVLSIVGLTVLLSIPLLGWFFGFKYAAISLATAMKRRRALIWLATLLASVPVTVAVTYLVHMLYDFRDGGALVFMLLAAAPIAHLTVTATAIAVELHRSRARRAMRAEMEAT